MSSPSPVKSDQDSLDVTFSRSKKGSSSGGFVKDTTKDKDTERHKVKGAIETRQEGSVKARNYVTYFTAGAGWPGLVMVILFYGIAVAFAVSYDLMIAQW